MSSAAVDRALAVLVVALAATGVISLHAGNPDDGWLFLVHAFLAGALALMVVRKLRSSVPRAVAGKRYVRLAFGLLVSLLAVAALAGGYVWASSPGIIWVDAGGLGRWTLLTLHAWAGLVLLPILAVHLLPKRWRLLRPSRRAISGCPSAPRLSRRAFLAGGAMAMAGVGLWAGSSVVERLTGGWSRFTGSRMLPAGAMPIATTFLGEPTPAIDAASWRLSVEGAVERPAVFDLAALQALGDHEVRAVLDCTSGWAVETTWRGVPMAWLLDAAGIPPTARRVEVRSVTGWSTSLEVAEARQALLAWSVAGSPLPVANGAPVRLVAPNHRGVDWVKWVSSVSVE
jgi:DMSO/TMAO reductase YedYZ molybdopterin-dependent catalytic subunit